MSSLTIGFVSAGSIFGGVLLGMFLQKVLPEHHLDDASKDTVKLGAGMLATLTALVLGLLVSSAKSSFDGMNDGVGADRSENNHAGSCPRQLRAGNEGSPRAITTYRRLRD